MGQMERGIDSVACGLLCVMCEPYGREMTPAKLADDDVAAVAERVTNVDGMVAAFCIILPVLLVLGHDGMGRGGVKRIRITV